MAETLSPDPALAVIARRLTGQDAQLRCSKPTACSHAHGQMMMSSCHSMHGYRRRSAMHAYVMIMTCRHCRCSAAVTPLARPGVGFSNWPGQVYEFEAAPAAGPAIVPNTQYPIVNLP